MTKAYTTFTTRTKASKKTVQTEKAVESQVENNAGGFVFDIGPWKQLDRFLILGTASSTYYVGEKELTRENAVNVETSLKEDGLRVVNRIVEVSDQGRAMSNDPALFALALASASESVEVRKAALAALPKVARIGTHLFHFAQYVEQFRGWGKLLKNAVQSWYQDKDVDQLAYQLVKYQSRDGWSHRDLLRLSKPKTDDVRRNAVYRWAVGKGGNEESNVNLIHAFEVAKKLGEKNVKEMVSLITEYNMPREAIPTHFLNSKEVWNAMLPHMPLTATIRNLGKMTSIGLIAPNSEAANIVANRLKDQEYIRKSRVHPMQVLIALRTYQNGSGFRGSLSWNSVSKVTDALDDAFYLSFGNVESTGKSLLLALDVSGSMSSSINNLPISCAEGTAAMAMVTARSEQNYEIMGFAHEFKDLKITAKDSLQGAMKKVRDNNFGSTDCSLPMIWAKKNKYNFDAFTVYTDNETYSGNQHPFQALKDYRHKTGIPAKLAVVAMSASKFSIADPSDPGMIDVVGFDSNTPQALSEFYRM